jgi:hypothetical protein
MNKEMAKSIKHKILWTSIDIGTQLIRTFLGQFKMEFSRKYKTLMNWAT